MIAYPPFFVHCGGGGGGESLVTIQMNPECAWSELMIGARQPTDAVDRLLTSPYLSFKDKPEPLMRMTMRQIVKMKTVGSYLWLKNLAS